MRGRPGWRAQHGVRDLGPQETSARLADPCRDKQDVIQPWSRLLLLLTALRDAAPLGRRAWAVYSAVVRSRREGANR